MSGSLFREAVVAAQGERLYGELVISQPLSTRLLVTLLAVVTLAGGLWLAGNSYQRKVTVAGQMVADTGVVDMVAPVTGRVTEVFVRPGQQVPAGTPLFSVESSRFGNEADDVGHALLATMELQAVALREQLAQEAANELRLRQSRDSEQLLAATTVEQRRNTLDRQQQLLDIRQRQAGRAQQLQQQRLLAQADLDQLQVQLLQQQQLTAEAALAVEQAMGAVSALALQYAERLGQSAQLQQRLQAELAQNGRQQLQQQLELRSTPVAPVAGRITSLLATTGMSVQAQQPLLTLLPDSAALEVELQVPSRAMGFIAEGQQVMLRFDAFSYQKFGVQQARIVRVAGTPVVTENGQSFYRVLAQPAQQGVAAYGQHQPLRPGLRVSADIRIDERTLLEWLLEPLYSIKGY